MRARPRCALSLCELCGGAEGEADERDVLPAEDIHVLRTRMSGHRPALLGRAEREIVAAPALRL